jgi:hypothetical protein
MSKEAIEREAAACVAACQQSPIEPTELVKYHVALLGANPNWSDQCIVDFRRRVAELLRERR